MAIITTLWIGNGAVLKSFSQWQLKEFLKINNSWMELYIFQYSKYLQYSVMNFIFECYQNRVLRGSVVECLTCSPEVLGLSCTGSSGFVMGVSLGKTL